jgi:uncharacterized protein YndB with AHSA1/START domain
MTDDKPKSRSHERTIHLDADPKTVWEAITDPEVLPRWFPMEAEVKPGEGGEIMLGWGPEMRGTVPILVWEPGRHLRTGWQAAFPVDDEQQAKQMVVDWYLEAEGGGTTLRLVHSGFASGGKWDDEFDGTNRGWNIELRNLVQYLRHHQGKDRRLLGIRQPVPADPAAAWKKVFSAEGLRFASSGEPPAPGQRYEITTPDGERLVGEVLLRNAPLDFAGTLESHGHSVFRYSHESCFGQPEAFVWISTWGMPGAEADGLEQRLRDLLKGLFG